MEDNDLWKNAGENIEKQKDLKIKHLYYIASYLNFNASSVIFDFFPFKPGLPEIKIFYKNLSALFIKSSDISSPRNCEKNPQESKETTNLKLKTDEKHCFPANHF